MERTSVHDEIQHGEAALPSASTPRLISAGLVKRLDGKRHRVKLSNGKWYVAPEGFDLAALRTGGRVRITYRLVHHHYYASVIETL